jgi:uncharacterized membrane protein YccC
VLRLGIGQHLLNGLTVGMGVGVVTILFSQAFGFANGMAAGTGAICVSLADIPNPLASKFKILPLSWILACISSALIAVTIGHPAFQGLIVLLVSAVAGLLVGYGRWALPVSVLTMLSLVFTLGAPLDTLDDSLRHEQLFAGGGFAYMLVAFAATRLTEASSRRIAVAECLREFALYLRAIANFYDRDVSLTEVYQRVIEQQAALADHLQAARQQVFLGRRTEAARRLAAVIVVQLDALDTVVSAHSDYAPLRRGDTGPVLPHLVRDLARELADDIDGLALGLLRYRRQFVMPDRHASLDRISAAVNDLLAAADDAKTDPRSLRAARATRTKFAWVTEHLSRLPKALESSQGATDLLKDINLSAFLQPLSLSPKLLRRHLHFTAPVMRHAIRLSAAMAAGYGLIWMVPGLNHGNWILLTIAVILRAQYAITRQRRNDRLIGNLIGCLISALLLRLAPEGLQLALIPVAIGIAHAYVRVNYLVTSVAACIMAILSLHFLDPVAAPPIWDRLLDTVIGAAIAFLFARLLPRWEFQEAPQLVAGLMRSFTAYLDDALRRDISEQSYRLARKTLLESLAAMTESAGRVAGEPADIQAATPGLDGLLSAAYGLAAQIVGIRVLLRYRSNDIRPDFADDLLQQSRLIVLDQLTMSSDQQEVWLEEGDESGVDAENALRIRCAELCAAAAHLHEVAARYHVKTA